MTKEDAPELATTVDGDVRKLSTRPKEKETVVIAGASLVKNIFGTTMGKQDPRHYYVVKGFIFPVQQYQTWKIMSSPLPVSPPTRLFCMLAPTI